MQTNKPLLPIRDSAVPGSHPLDNEPLVPETLFLSTEADYVEYDWHDALTSAVIQKLKIPGFHNLLEKWQTLVTDWRRGGS